VLLLISRSLWDKEIYFSFLKTTMSAYKYKQGDIQFPYLIETLLIDVSKKKTLLIVFTAMLIEWFYWLISLFGNYWLISLFGKLLIVFNSSLFIQLYSNNVSQRNYLYLFFTSSLMTEAYTIKFKYGEVECSKFESRPLHRLCNVPTNCAKLTGTKLFILLNMVILEVW